MPRLSTTPIALRILAKMGCVADITERRVMKRLTKDWLGFGDIIAVPPKGVGVLVLQVTSMTNVSSRVNKILANENVSQVLRAENWVEVWGLNSEGSIKPRSIVLDSDGNLECKTRSDFIYYVYGKDSFDEKT